MSLRSQSTHSSSCSRLNGKRCFDEVCITGLQLLAGYFRQILFMGHYWAALTGIRTDLKEKTVSESDGARWWEYGLEFSQAWLDLIYKLQMEELTSLVTMINVHGKDFTLYSGYVWNTVPQCNALRMTLYLK